jgi:ribonuclease BN (tRNA processing enzyme)
MPRIILLGTGGPKPDAHRQGPCLAIESQGRYLIFDAGRGAATQMAAAGISVDQVNQIFITHHHYDHIGNLGDVILSGWNLGRKETLQVFGPKGTADIVDVLLNQVYKKDIEFRMTEAALTHVELANIHDGVRVKDVQPGLVYEDEVFQVFCEYVSHGHGLGISQDNWKCLGYRVVTQGKSIAVSGDAVNCDGLDRLAKDADALVLCCYLSKKELADMEGGYIARHILTCSPQAGQIAGRAGVETLILTHIREKNNEQINILVKEIQDNFKGQVIAGQDLLVVDV